MEKVSNFTPFQIAVDESSELGQESYRPETPDVLLGPVWAAIMDNKDFRQKSITDPFATRYKESGLTTGDKIYNKVNYIARSVVPLYSSYQDFKTSVETGEDFYNREKTVSDIAISKFIKIRTWDDKSLKKTAESALKSIDYNEKNIKTKIKAIERKYLRDLEQYDQRIQEGKMTKEQYKRKVGKMKENAERRVNTQLGLLVKEQEKMNLLIQRVEKLDLVDE